MNDHVVPQNIQKLADYINQQENPERFMRALLTLCKPCPKNIPDRQEETEITLG